MKNTLKLLTVLSTLLFVGCASLYKPASVVVITAEKAMSSYGHYYDVAIANPIAYKVTTDQLKSQRIKVNKAWEDYRNSMNLVDETRKAGGDIAAFLQTAQTYSDSLVNLVMSFLPNEFKPTN